MGASVEMASVKKNGADRRLRVAKRRALSSGVLDGIGGPALLGLKHHLSADALHWLLRTREARARRSYSSPTFDAQLESSTQRILAEILRTLETVAVQNGFVFEKVIEKQLDESGKLRQKERLVLRKPSRLRHGETK